MKETKEKWGKKRRKDKDQVEFAWIGKLRCFISQIKVQI